MLNKKMLILQLIFAVFLAVSFSGCTDDATDSDSGSTDVVDTENYDAETSSSSYYDENSEIRELVKNHEEIWSYTFEYLLETKNGDQMSNLMVSGKVDTKNKKSYISISSDSGTVESYYFEDATYLGTNEGGETSWMKIPAENDNFEGDYDIISMYNENIYDFENSNFELVGEETVNGIRCYKIMFDIKDQYNDYGIAANAAGENEISKLDVAEVVYYVDKAEGYLIKTTVTAKGTEKSGETFEFKYVLSFKDINKVQDIELSSAAQNAIDITSYYSE